MYRKSMETIKAREKLSLLDVACFDKHKQRDKRKMLKNLNKLSNITLETRKLSLAEAMKSLGGIDGVG